ncbi:MAG TPA: hypothetical protein VJ577_07135 [Burkholderiaceae bacterium]|nr:hypothetical protein [Burkholderiaceae bacterium]
MDKEVPHVQMDRMVRGMMGFGMLLFWLLPIGLIAALVLYLNDRNRKSNLPQRAIDILENAYARGAF